MYIYSYKVNINVLAVITSGRIKTHLKYGHGFIGVSPRRKANACMHFFPGLKISTMILYPLQPPSLLWLGLHWSKELQFWFELFASGLWRNCSVIPWECQEGGQEGALHHAVAASGAPSRTLVACHGEHHRQPSSWKGVVIKVLDFCQPASVHCEPGLCVHKWPDLNTW